jgi:hypothetical protein
MPIDDGSIFTLPGMPIATLDDDFIPQQYVGNYNSLVLNIGADAYAGTLTPQGTNDPSDPASWQTIKMIDMASLDAEYTSSAGFVSVTNRVFGCTRTYLWFRVRMTEYTSGSPGGILQCYRNGLPGFQLQYIFTRSQFGHHLLNQDGGDVLTSGAVTVNGNSPDYTNNCARGVKLYITSGTFGAGASAITVTLQGRDLSSGTYFDIVTSASLTTSSFAVLTAYPGVAVTANVSASDILPHTWRVKWQAANWGTGGSTLGIGCAMNG